MWGAAAPQPRRQSSASSPAATEAAGLDQRGRHPVALRGNGGAKESQRGKRVTAGQKSHGEVKESRRGKGLASAGRVGEERERHAGPQTTAAPIRIRWRDVP